MKIAVDFDGTCVTHEYPRIGKDIGAVPVLKGLIARGHRLILNTMRSGKELEEAVKWFRENGIPLHGINEDPGQREWTESPKVFSHLYIDDAALGCPLCFDNSLSEKPFVDWERVDTALMNLEERWKSNPPRESDPVNHPSHYTFGKTEVIEVLEDWFPTDPLLWQVGKYLARAGRKGETLEDLEKAAWYLKRRIEREKEKSDAAAQGKNE